MRRGATLAALAACASAVVLIGYHAAPSSGGSAGAPPPKAASAPATPREDAFWARAKIEVYRTAGELAAQRARELRKGLQYDILPHGDPHVKSVALTFDDGPHPAYTPQLLAILRQERVPATFFVVGVMAEQYPEQIRAERAAGHVVGNHTLHHVNLTKIPLDEVLVEWQACQDVVKSITGDTMRYCRPPGGDYDDAVVRAAMSVHLTTVLWTDDPGDYASPGAKVVETRVLDRIGNGGIILLHDGVQQTIDILPGLIEHLRSKGYRFVTVSELQSEAAAHSRSLQGGPASGG
ncbi:MAG: polysaccharide deacetylase family protein [Armatimonadota bacterium]